MNGNPGRHPITLKRVSYRLPGMEDVSVQRDLPYRSTVAGVSALDVYHGRGTARDEAAPLVLIVTGYPDVGVPRPLGCTFKEMEMWVSLAQLLAVSGLTTVTYTTEDPAADASHAIDYVTSHAQALRLDATRIGLWAVSGHVPTALAMLARDAGRRIKAAVLSTGFMLDLAGSTVADAARTYGFANAADGIHVSQLPATLPLFIARAGKDANPGLNDVLDRFAGAALARNLPVTIVNHAEAGHAFELNDPGPITDFFIAQMLAFMQFWLTR